MQAVERACRACACLGECSFFFLFFSFRDLLYLHIASFFTISCLLCLEQEFLSILSMQTEKREKRGRRTSIVCLTLYERTWSVWFETIWVPSSSPSAPRSRCIEAAARLVDVRASTPRSLMDVCQEPCRSPYCHKDYEAGQNDCILDILF